MLESLNEPNHTKKTDKADDSEPPTLEAQFQPVVVGAVNIPVKKQCSWFDGLVDRHEGSEASPEWKVSLSGL